jgi:signal transduction histidine kinase
MLAERSEENASLREVARALAEEVDLSALLQVICREAMVQCDAAGATVGQLDEGEVTVVAGVGVGEAAIGFDFPLRGSLTERAIVAHAPVRADDYRAEFPRLAPAFRGREIGPVIIAPLTAHDQVLGALLVARRPGDRPFTDREERRIRGISDHAALAIWKTRLFEEVQEANRTKSEFMATISHELRTPLTALTGYEELLADEVFGPLTEQQMAAIERMRTSTDLLTVIIEEILTFSRLEAGEEPVRPSETTAQEIVDAAVGVLEPLALEKQLELNVITPDSPLTLFTDGDMVRRILVNLGANAIKFTEKGTVEIEASLCASNSEVCFAVRDTGIGIAKADLPRLFQPFTQLDAGFTRRYGGTGLGLFISQRLARLLGGIIEVESELGQGSVFTARIPREWEEHNE